MGEKEHKGWRNEIKKKSNIRKNGGTNRNTDRHEERKSVAIQWNLQEQIDSY